MIRRRVLTVIAAPHWGGLHTVVERTTPFLSDAGYERIVLLPVSDPQVESRLTKSGCIVKGLPLARLRKRLSPSYHIKYLISFISDLKHIRSLISNERIDIVEVAGLLNLQPLIAAWTVGVPVVYQLHSDSAPAVLRSFIASVFGRLAAVIMTSGRGLIKRHGGLESLGKPLVPFCAPIDSGEFCRDDSVRAATRVKLGLRDDIIVVGTLGNRGWQKRHEWIVEVANELADSRFAFIIAGAAMTSNESYYQMEVVGRVARYGLGETVKIIDSNLPANELFNAFDIFILTSVSEGASLVTAEAMSVGLPIVAANVGSLSDLVSADNGFLCSPSAVIPFVDAVRALGSSGLRKALGARSREKIIASNSTKLCAESHLSAYAKALEAKDL